MQIFVKLRNGFTTKSGEKRTTFVLELDDSVQTLGDLWDLIRQWFDLKTPHKNMGNCQELWKYFMMVYNGKHFPTNQSTPLVDLNLSDEATIEMTLRMNPLK